MPVEPINVEYYIGSQPPLDGNNNLWATAFSSFVNAGFGDMLTAGTHSLEKSLIVYGITVPEGRIVSQQINVAFSTSEDGNSGTVSVGNADAMTLDLVNNAIQSAVVDPLAEYAGGALGLSMSGLSVGAIAVTGALDFLYEFVLADSVRADLGRIDI